MKFYAKAHSIRKPNALEEQFCKFNYSMEIRGSADIRDRLKSFDSIQLIVNLYIL